MECSIKRSWGKPINPVFVNIDYDTVGGGYPPMVTSFYYKTKFDKYLQVIVLIYWMVI